MPKKRTRASYRKAALKGWRTRLANERSERARKGWKTRKKRYGPTGRKPKGKKAPQYMWRVVVAAPYYTRTGKKRSDYESAAYMVRAWFKTRRSAEETLEELEDSAREGRENALDNRSWLFGDDVNTEISKVDYEARLLDIIEEEDER